MWGLQYGAIGLLAVVVFGALGITRAMLIPYIRDTLLTNQELRILCQVLREALQTQSDRLDHIETRLEDTESMVRDLHQTTFGTGRSLLLRGKS